MPVYSLLSNVTVEYAIAEGKPLVRLRAPQGIRSRGAYGGTGVMFFHWVQEGKTQAWRYDPSIPEPSELTPEVSTDPSGAQLLTFSMESLLPASGLLRGRWEGAFLAPAIHIDVPLGADVWVFLLRSPWFPLKITADKSMLSVVHDASTATASVSPSGDGGLAIALSCSGPSIKRATLLMKRKVGQFSSEEVVAEVEKGQADQVWRPIIRQFELCLLTSGSMSERQLSEWAGGLGAAYSSGFLGPGNLEGDFILCDGPLTEYSLTLRGDLGFMRHAEDTASVTLSW